MIRFTIIVMGVMMAVIGGIKIWFHLNTGDVLILEGCQGAIFTMNLGQTSAHCWGCYSSVIGSIMALAGGILPSMRFEMPRNLQSIKIDPR